MRSLSTPAVLASVLAVGAGCGGTGNEAIRTVRVYDLLRAFPAATVQAPPVDYVAVATRAATLGGIERPTLFLHPTSSVEFPAVAFGEDAVLTAFIGLEDAVRDKPGDGVDFVVSVKLADGVVVKVFSQYLDPRVRHEDRGWIPIRVPLGAFAGQRAHLVFSTGPGAAGDSQFDWALWAAPTVLLDGL